jgi:hypothetical protein
VCIEGRTGYNGFNPKNPEFIYRFIFLYI